MRHQNKGIFTHNNNLEWLLLAFETTRFGGGKTKSLPKSSLLIMNPKVLAVQWLISYPHARWSVTTNRHAHTLTPHAHACLQAADQVA